MAIEYQLGEVAPEVSIVYRYVIGSVSLFIYCKYKKLDLKFKVTYHLWFAVLGVFLFCLNYIFAYRAQVHITSALAAIVFSTMLWINIILSRLVFGTRAGPRVLFGAVLGITGIVTLFAPQVGEIALSDAVLYGSLLAFLGALMASIGNILSQAAQQRALPVVQANAWGMLYGALLTAVICAVHGYEFTFAGPVTNIASLV